VRTKKTVRTAVTAAAPARRLAQQPGGHHRRSRHEHPGIRQIHSMFCHAFAKRDKARRWREHGEKPHDPERNKRMRSAEKPSGRTESRETSQGNPPCHVEHGGRAMDTVHDRLSRRPGQQADISPDHDRLREQVEQRRGRPREAAHHQQPVDREAAEHDERRHIQDPEPPPPRSLLTRPQQPVVREHHNWKRQTGLLGANREKATRKRSGSTHPAAARHRAAREQQRGDEPDRAHQFRPPGHVRHRLALQRVQGKQRGARKCGHIGSLRDAGVLQQPTQQCEQQHDRGRVQCKVGQVIAERAEAPQPPIQRVGEIDDRSVRAVDQQKPDVAEVGERRIRDHRIVVVVDKWVVKRVEVSRASGRAGEDRQEPRADT
jgi:hypothetical protein